MSDSQCQSKSVKRRLEEIDVILEKLSQGVGDMSDFGLKAKIEHKITTIRLKREKTQALAAVARSQNILAEMEIMIAQNEVNNEIEKLKTFKRIRFDDVHNNSVLGNGQPSDTPLQTQADKSSQTKKSSSKVKAKKTVNNQYTSSNSQNPTKDYNKTPELNNPLPGPSNSELINKTFENRTPPNSINSMFEVNNKLASVDNNLKVAKLSNKKAENSFKIPLNGQKNRKGPVIMPANVSRHNLPAVVSQPQYMNRADTSNIGHKSNTKVDNGAPSRLIYGDETIASGGDLFNRTPEADVDGTNPYQDLVNDFYRDLMMSKRDSSTPAQVQIDCLETSMNTTIELELQS